MIFLTNKLDYITQINNEYFFGRASQKIACKNIKKVKVKVHEVYISPYCRLALVPPNFMKFGIRGSTHRCNHVCQIFSRSVQGLRSSDTPEIAISHWLAASPLQQCSTAVRHCDTKDIYMWLLFIINSCYHCMSCCKHYHRWKNIWNFSLAFKGETFADC